MRIAPDIQDSDAFIVQVEALANGLLLEHAPKSLILIKVDSWFGFKWLHFSGKALGKVGAWLAPVTVPPFVPSRIIHSAGSLLQPIRKETSDRQYICGCAVPMP